jgi:hypothetical protein
MPDSKWLCLQRNAQAAELHGQLGQMHVTTGGNSDGNLTHHALMSNRSPPTPMTLGNMRANGVNTLEAWCLAQGCGHSAILDVAGFAGDVPVPSFGPRLRCKRCGRLGADARPNWQEIAGQSLFGQK